jgi:hypothetical protein
MAWRECKRVVITCVACASIPTFCLATLGDGLSKETIGPPFWIASALVGIAVGAVAGSLACVLVRPKSGLKSTDAEAVDKREVTILRYVLGITLAVIGAGVSLFLVLDAIAAAMPWRF